MAGMNTKPTPPFELLAATRPANVIAIVRMTHRVFTVRYAGGVCVVREIRHREQHVGDLPIGPLDPARLDPVDGRLGGVGAGREGGLGPPLTPEE